MSALTSSIPSLGCVCTFNGLVFVCRQCECAFIPFPLWDYAYVCVHTYACAHVYHCLCLQACLSSSSPSGFASRINISLSVHCCGDGLDLSRRGNEERDKWRRKEVRGWGCEYCHAGSTWEWHSVAGEKDEEERGGREAKRALVKWGEEEGVAGLSWSIAKWSGHGLVSLTLSWV